MSQAFCFVSCFFYPPRSSAKVSGALLASGPFSWKLQLGYAAVYHTALVTSLSSPLAALVSLGLHRREYLEGHSQPAGGDH